MKKSFIWTFILGLIFFSLVISGLASYFAYDQAIYTPLDPETQDSVSFTVESGESGLAVLEKLSQAGLIRSHFWGKIYFLLQQQEGQLIEAGEYELSANQTLEEIYQSLQHGTFDLTFTIPEGLRLEEIAQIVQEKLDLSAQEFFQKNNNYRGRLFPDTYTVPEDISLEEVSQFMKDNFNQQIKDLTAEIESHELSQNEILILASIVEREGNNADDRQQIANILVKRYRKDWLLEADATVQFAVGSKSCRISNSDCQWWPTGLSETDLKLESPYNTRLYAGLPPTPICSPGIESIRSVVKAQNTPYWFYLTGKDGQTHYSVSYEEHLNNINRYL